MPVVVTTDVFDAWINGLRDRQGRARITVRIDRLAAGNPGDHKGVGEGVTELRIKFGPGYRVYYWQRGAEVILLLAGGDKDSQSADVARAKAIKAELEAAEAGDG